MTLQTVQAPSRQNLIAMLLVAAAMIAGGGGSPAPVPELALELFALFMVACWAVISPRPLPDAAPLAWGIAGLLLVLPVVQLVPLPPAFWHRLPARETQQAALALVGAQDTWRPWSVAPARTLASLLALTTPAIVLVMTASLTRSGRNMAMGMIAGVALLALLVGAAQMTGGEASTFRFYVPDVGYLNGFQANHNSAADVLLIGMVACAASVREWSVRRGLPDAPGYRLGLVGGSTILFSLGVFLTASRAGALLLPVAWAAVVLIVWPWLRFSRRALGVTLAATAILAALAIFALLSSGVVARVLGRFQFEGEFRPQIWRDALYAVEQYLPFGSGLGTFVPVFMAVERLEVVDPTVANRAHNDVLELLVEGGVFGAAILAVITTLLLKRLWASLRDPPERSMAQVYFAGATFAIIAAHSQVDYPLRSMALASIAAVAAGLLMPGVNAAKGNAAIA